MLMYDDEPLARIATPYVTWALLAATALSFVAGLSQPSLVTTLGFQPEAWFAHPGDPWRLAGLITHVFAHGGWLHLISNLLVLFVMGDNVEDALGHVRFLVLYLLSAVAGALLEAALAPHAQETLVGASSALAGVMGAYLLLYPRARLLTTVFMRFAALVPASWFVGTWFCANVIRALTRPDDEVAWFAHIGGFLAGIALVVVLRQPGVPLFQTRADPPAEGKAEAPWHRRWSLDFAPPSAAGNNLLSFDSESGAAIGKAALFLLLLLLGAFF